LLLPKRNFDAAAIFHAIYVVRLVYFCVVPGMAGQSVMRGAPWRARLRLPLPWR
jgi:uncharacterized membrane protein